MVSGTREEVTAAELDAIEARIWEVNETLKAEGKDGLDVILAVDKRVGPSGAQWLDQRATARRRAPQKKVHGHQPMVREKHGLRGKVLPRFRNNGFVAVGHGFGTRCQTPRILKANASARDERRHGQQPAWLRRAGNRTKPRAFQLGMTTASLSCRRCVKGFLEARCKIKSSARP